jgi:hypothetical protein
VTILFDLNPSNKRGGGWGYGGGYIRGNRNHPSSPNVTHAQKLVTKW